MDGPIAGARAIASDPDDRVWIAAETSESQTWFDRKNERGLLKFGGAIGGLKGIRMLALSPDGKTIYAAGADKIWVVSSVEFPNKLMPGADQLPR
jgi:hypothetical protein